jgi:uncharacterized membrane protein YphA (DoxX/SURF4 family)
MNSKLTMVLRIVLALVLLVFGANHFFGFMPSPTLPADSFIPHIIATGYLWQLIGLIEIIAGLLLILNKWKGFALVIMAPISVNIVLYHLTYDIANFGPGALVAVLNVLLIYANWDKFKTLF